MKSTAGGHADASMPTGHVLRALTVPSCTVLDAAGNGANHTDVGLGLLHINAQGDAQAMTIGASLCSIWSSVSCCVACIFTKLPSSSTSPWTCSMKCSNSS
jgi:hypothetical protein